VTSRENNIYLFISSANETEWETQVSWLFPATGAVEPFKQIKVTGTK